MYNLLYLIVVLDCPNVCIKTMSDNENQLSNVAIYEMDKNYTTAG